ncbi:MAG TPA: hypothetical protein VNQ76_06180 [Planctomicrobium sp.]|nr:hypothetical protein [Planctomicrobium sp.]
MMLLPNRCFSRIVWKEYRAQYQIWLALLIGAIVFQAFFLFFDTTTQQVQPDYPIAVGVILTLCYTVSCGAILFAGEREEETDRFLQTLPFPAWKFFAGKLTYAFLSIALFAGGTYLTGYAIALAVSPSSVSRFSNPEGLMIIPFSKIYLEGALIPSFLSFASAAVVSILTNRVMFALVGGSILTVSLNATLIHIQREVSPEIYSLSGGVILLTVCGAFVPAWLHGGPRWFAVSGWAGYLRERSWHRAFRTRFLKWASSRAAPAARMFGVLIWKEFCGVIPMLLISILAIFVLRLTPVAQYFVEFSVRLNLLEAKAAAFNSFFFWGYVLSTALGVLTFSGDSRQQRMQFLTDRGASPGMIWLSKLLIWTLPLWVLFVAVGFFCWIDTVVLQSVGLVEITLFERSPFAEIFRHFAFGVVCCYAVAQLISLWVGRIVLAASIATMMAIFLAMCHRGLAAWDIPFWFSSGVFTLSCLAASYFTLEGWLKQTRSWRRVAVQTTWILVPLMIITISIRQWRIIEIPLTSPGFDWQEHEKEMAQFDLEWSKEWAALNATMPTGKDSGVEEFRNFHFMARHVSERILDNPGLKLDPSLVLNQDKIIETLNRSLNLTPSGSGTPGLDEKWERLHATFVLNRYLRNLSSDSRQLWNHDRFQRGLNDSLRRWIQDHRQTPELLTKCLDAQWGKDLPQNGLRNQYVTQRQILERRDWGWQWALQQDPSLANPKFPLLTAILFSQERERNLRLLNWQNRLLMPRKWFSLIDPELARRKVIQWERTTSRFPGDEFLSELHYVSIYSREIVIEDTAGILLLAGLERYRLLHGAYPESLNEINSDLPSDMLLAAARFHYEPHGFSFPLVISPKMAFPAGQPLLIQTGNARTTTFSRLIPEGFLDSDVQTRLEANDQGKKLLNQLQSKEILWAYDADVPPIRNHAQDRSEAIKTLRQIREKTDRVQYVRKSDITP